MPFCIGGIGAVGLVPRGDSFAAISFRGADMRIRDVLLATAIAIAAAQPALAGEGIYIGAGFGFESPSASKWNVPSVSQFGNYSLQDTNTFIADAGYKFSNGFRVELEGQDASFDGDKIAIAALSSSPLKGHISEGTLYLNGNYDFPIIHGLGGTVGAGVGSAWNDAHGSAFSGLAVLRGSDRAFAWQVGGGLTHHVLSNLDLQVDYRYQGVGSTTLTENGTGAFHLGNIKTQTVTASVRFYILP
jgi:opacity protein-like surface antigen